MGFAQYIHETHKPGKEDRLTPLDHGIIAQQPPHRSANSLTPEPLDGQLVISDIDGNNDLSSVIFDSMARVINKLSYAISDAAFCFEFPRASIRAVRTAPRMVAQKESAASEKNK